VSSNSSQTEVKLSNSCYFFKNFPVTDFSLREKEKEGEREREREKEREREREKA
jgi:hypothetical protein